MLEHKVDLDLPPDKRWAFLTNYKREMSALLQCYLNDFEGADLLFQNIKLFKEAVVSKEYQEEIKYIASLTDFSEDEVLLANLYYDALKLYFGCTAFAVYNGNRILHARNLDWHTDNNLLAKHSMVFNFTKGNKIIFKTIGWPGFIGALSGVKPGKFSLTLNAVLSNDAPQIATPISFLLRDVLCSSESYKEAKELLEQKTIASDCLILLSGMAKNEMVVIERTPNRFATREAKDNHIVVTNNYMNIPNQTSGESILQTTSCGRLSRAEVLLKEKMPNGFEECMKILGDPDIMMFITVQQMVFDNSTGNILLSIEGKK